MDGLVAGLAKEINECKNEIIEAFTPPPDGDLPLRVAREMWPEKIIWINFPCSLHLESTDVIKNYTRKLLEEINPKNRFLFGITENFSNKNIKIRENISTILDILKEY